MTFAGTGRLPGRDVYRDVTFAGTGLQWSVSTRDDLQSQHNHVPINQDGVFTWY